MNIISYLNSSRKKLSLDKVLGTLLRLITFEYLVGVFVHLWHYRLMRQPMYNTNGFKALKIDFPETTAFMTKNENK